MIIPHYFFTPDRKEMLFNILITESFTELELLEFINNLIINYYLQYLGISMEEADKYLSN